MDRKKTKLEKGKEECIDTLTDEKNSYEYFGGNEENGS